MSSASEFRQQTPSLCSDFFSQPKKVLAGAGLFLTATGIGLATTPWFLKFGFAITLAPLVVSKLLLAGFFIATVGIAMITAGLIYDYYQRSKKDYAPFTSTNPQYGGVGFSTQDNEELPESTTNNFSQSSNFFAKLFSRRRG